MPYHNRARSRRKTTYRRRNVGTRYNFTYGNVVDKVIKDVAKLKGLINTEFKQKDTTATATVDNVADIILLNGLAKGDDFDDRDGRVVRIKSIQVSLLYEINASASLTHVRVMLVLDKQPNEITMVITDLLDSSGLQTFRNLDQRKRFWIIWNQVVTMSITGMQGGTLNFYKKFNLKTIYDDSDAGTIADISTNAIYLVLLSNEPTNLPTIVRSTRIRYIDN